MPEEAFSHRIRAVYVQYFAYWAWLVILIILMVGGIMLIYPKWQYIQSTGAFQYQQLVDTYQSKETELAQLKTMREQLISLNQSQLLYVEDTLPDSITPAQLMEQISNSLGSQGYTLQSIDVVDAKVATATTATFAGTPPTTPRDIPGVKELLLTVNITGDASYQGLKEFLRVVSSSNPILDLYAVSYSAERKSFSVVLTTYVAE